jgi:hypothetical protein
MKKIAILDVDLKKKEGHFYPNLALMKISSFYKRKK